MENNDKRLNFFWFLGDWFLRNCIAIFLLATAIQYWFQPFMYGLLVLLIISWIYASWMTVQEQFFWEEKFDFDTSDWALWFVWVIEGVFLLIALYFLNKGLLTITGAEQAFGLSWTPISMVMSVGFILFMFYLLLIIKKEERIRMFVFLYILLDFLVLMPFNFMYMFEAKQREELADFHGSTIPTLYTRLVSRISSKVGELEKSYGLVSALESGRIVDYQAKVSEIRQMDEEIAELRDQQRLDYSPARNEILQRLKREQTALIKKRNQLNTGHSSEVAQAGAEKDRFVEARKTITGLKVAVDSIQNGIAGNELKINTISACKNRLIQLVNQDPYFRQDSLILLAQAKLSIEASSRTEAFFQLLHDLFQPLLKENTTSPILAVAKKADPEWLALQPSIRWFSFLAALLIDAIPLLAVLVYRLYSR
ncbi:hypothetical protein LZD49_10090 [Dyadobacter sp. CY261]|uniref:hypothetical protein n=1 Tax=Dyadobacter sp. CY261 TaxID=2907203 RepID=UPI001F170A49|nr:hypothetical protein [Dyadobacter sp. CY261]MCF0070822.1 hypothetical protein [Dyadobacter sp. CY261]